MSQKKKEEGLFGGNCIFLVGISLWLTIFLLRIIMKPAAVEFVVHMSLSAAVASVNSLAEECLVVDRIEGNKSKSTSVSRSEHSGPAARKGITHQRVSHTSITGARLDLEWRELTNVEYLTDGGNSWIHTAVYDETPVVVKTLKPECQDVALAINEIEGELCKYLVLWTEVECVALYVWNATDTFTLLFQSFKQFTRD